MTAALVAEGIAAVAGLVIAGLLVLFVRNRVLHRGGGTIDLSLRLRRGTHGRGWVLGVGRFEGDALQWYRAFSLALRPRRTLSRRDLRVVARREPVGPERLALLSGSVVMECTSSTGDVHLAMEPSAVTGFLAWLEATPPGATLPA